MKLYCKVNGESELINKVVYTNIDGESKNITKMYYKSEDNTIKEILLFDGQRNKDGYIMKIEEFLNYIGKIKIRIIIKKE